MNRPLDEALGQSGIALPASKKQLKKLGMRLAAGSEETSDWDLYAQTVEFFDVLQTVLVRSLQSIPWAEVVGRDVEVNIVGRAKTLDTLLQKLTRTPQIGLANVRDVAGVRLVADITLAEQDRIVDVVGETFGVPSAGVVDRRAEPESGYRAVHLIVPVLDVQIELQIRTRLQHLWAEVFEKLADSWGRQIRYGGVPDRARPGDVAPDADRPMVIEVMQRMSVQSLAAAEVSRSATQVLRDALAEAAPGAADNALASVRTITTELMPDLPPEIDHPENLAEVVEWRARVAGDVEAEVETMLLQLLALLADEEEQAGRSGYAGEVEEES